jgi:protein-S-isoprenylcysteine O-methyltransferase Ste14
MDAPRALVIVGPYRHVRNPMAILGLGQGIGVALMLGSRLVLSSVVAGGVFWHVGVRPAEERDLLARFGTEHARHRASVPVWVPRVRRDEHACD